jgi:hypothetical protein
MMTELATNCRDGGTERTEIGMDRHKIEKSREEEGKWHSHDIGDMVTKGFF